jgi:AcrR family transcriptional regulator
MPAATAPGKARTLQEQKHDLVRREIWKAAIALFVQHGFDATTVEQIAEAAGVSPRTVFRYYPTKESVMLESVDDYGDALLAAIAAQPENRPPLATVRSAVLAITQRAYDDPSGTRDFMRILQGSSALRAAQLLRFSQIEERLRTEFARRSGQNPKRDSTSKLLAWLTMGAIDIAYSVWFERKTEKMRPIVEEVFEKLSRIMRDAAGQSR